MAKFLGETGLVYLWAKIKSYVSGAINTIVVPSAGSTTPAMDGTGNTGSSSDYARADHVHPSDTNKQDVINDLDDIRSGAAAGATAYQKPQTGIPSSDMASTVQTSLGKADTAYQLPIGGVPSTDLSSSVQDALTAAGNAIPNTQRGVANGVAALDANGKVPSDQLPSYVDDVIEAYARSGQTALSQNWLATGSASGTVITPEAGKIYVLMNSGGTDYPANSQYRWGGTTYVIIGSGGVSELTTAEMDTATNNWT